MGCFVLFAFLQGKGVKYSDETVLRKEGKSGK
jgi:ribosomal protein L6P/L9E